jgi:hypothetical protein
VAVRGVPVTIPGQHLHWGIRTALHDRTHEAAEKAKALKQSAAGRTGQSRTP